jgi:tRNA1(Val) A37 N6-methylase TrmN6
MAIMFNRVAHNYAKAGFYPTMPDSLKGILNFLTVQSEDVRIFDPCCGEGDALATVAAHLTELGSKVHSVGVEFDADRYQLAKNQLHHVIRSDYFDVLHKDRGVGLLWLNPPYGEELVGQQKHMEASSSKTRFEQKFFEKSILALQAGGVLVMLVPSTCMTEEMVKSLSYYCDSFRLFKAPEQKYNQLIIFAKRRKIGDRQATPKAILEQLLQAREYAMDSLPQDYLGEKYCVPASPSFPFAPITYQVNPEELAEQLDDKMGIWQQFEAHFNCEVRSYRRPLAALTDWHLALALASGQLGGIIESNGRRFLIKGGTHKVKDTTLQTIDGVDTIIAIDRFVPIIRAIDLTVNGAAYGEVFEIH